MTGWQTLIASILLALGVTVGVYLAFPGPVAYDFVSLPDQLTQSMRKNGVSWASVEVDGDNVFVYGNAPNDAALFQAESVIREAGVKASFAGVKVKSVQTSDDFDGQEAWQEFKEDNPVGRYQLPGRLPDTTTSISTSSPGIAERSGNAIAASVSPPAPVQEYLGIDLVSKNSRCQQPPGALHRLLVVFKENTPSITADSLSQLDQLAAAYKSCPMVLDIGMGNGGEDNLYMRRMDELRYHLMAIGINSADIRHPAL